MRAPQEERHLLQPAFLGAGDARAGYDRAGLLATSEHADTFLIRSWLAYHGGAAAAERASIRRSRGLVYRVARYGTHDRDDRQVRIRDHYDHRAGVEELER